MKKVEEDHKLRPPMYATVGYTTGQGCKKGSSFTYLKRSSPLLTLALPLGSSRGREFESDFDGKQNLQIKQERKNGG